MRGCAPTPPGARRSRSPVAVKLSALKKGAWSHIALSWTPAGQALYVNGVAVATGAGPSPGNADGTAHIGYIDRGGTGVPPLYGFVSEVRISTIGRDTASFTPEAHLLADSFTTALYKLKEGSGTKAKDSAASNDGVISGATWQPAPCR